MKQVKKIKEARENNEEYKSRVENLVLYSLDNGEYQKVTDAIESLGLSSEGDSSLYNNLGVLYIRQNLYEKSIENFEKSIEMGNKNIGVYINLSRVYLEEKKFNDAIETLEKAKNIYENKRN